MTTREELLQDAAQKPIRRVVQIDADFRHDNETDTTRCSVGHAERDELRNTDQMRLQIPVDWSREQVERALAAIVEHTRDPDFWDDFASLPKPFWFVLDEIQELDHD